MRLTTSLIVLLLAATPRCKPETPKEPAKSATAKPAPAPAPTKAAAPAVQPKEPKPAADVEEAAIAMPGHWKQTASGQFPAALVEPIATKLGGQIDALRNTVYDVGGKRVQLNVIDAADAANADKIMASLKRMKSDKALLRRGNRIFEFVGKNDVLAEIIKARKLLDSKLPR